jgi:regulator of sigma E protease
VITTILAAIIVLGVLIFVHELGHFLIAKLSRVGVLTFSLGFGPKLFGKKIGETQYQVSMVPLGGYVKMVGEELDEEVPPEMASRSFSIQPVRTRLAIVFAGPFFNYLFAVFAFAAVLMLGMPTLLPEIGEVKPDYPAQLAGLQKGDRIVAVNGVPIQRWEDLAKMIHASKDGALQLKVDREGKTLQVSVTPRISTETTLFGDEVQVGLIGISPAGTFFVERFDPFTATRRAIFQSWKITQLTVLSIIKIIEGKISAKTIGGPILIAQMAGQQAKAGLLSLLIFMAVISINLVILNILPIPVLDGWHLLMFIIEGIRRRPVSLHIRERAQQVGIFIIILLMLLVFYNDLSRITGTP